MMFAFFGGGGGGRVFAGGEAFRDEDDHLGMTTGDRVVFRLEGKELELRDLRKLREAA